MLALNQGSFRDPSGHVYETESAIFRTVAPIAADNYEAARDQGLLKRLVKDGRIVGLCEVDPVEYGLASDVASYLLRHPRLPYISYPYEWSFSLLRDAALFHLDLNLELLEQGFTLSDASAYNVQFVGPKPVFIDHLSIRRYRDGEFWTAHRQFCEQFLNPLLLRSISGVAHNAWYRGNVEGIPVADLAKLLPLRRRLSWRVLTHIVLQNRFQQNAGQSNDIAKLQKRRLPHAGYKGMMTQLRRWIAGLASSRIGSTTWQNYADCNTYDDTEKAEKAKFISKFTETVRPETLIDLGCNTGDYSKVALANGARRVIGFDFDQQALDRAHERAKAEDLDFLPLFLDAKNPSPDQGWLQAERYGYGSRANADGVLALAFIHHLAIAHNVPLEQAIGWIVQTAPSGVIEFVPKADPTVRQMLALRDDIFPDYDIATFSALLQNRARIHQQEMISNSGRTLFWYGR